MLYVSLDNTQGVGVAHAALPALDDNHCVVVGEDVELQRLGDTPLDTSIDILLPVNLGEVGLVLGEVEGIYATVQVSVPGSRGVTCDHEDGANGTVLGEQAGGITRGG